MTTIIERPSGGSDGGGAVIAVFVGVIAAAVIAMLALGTFDRRPAEMNLTIETPAAATAPTAPTAPQAAPAESQPVAPDSEPAPPPE